MDNNERWAVAILAAVVAWGILAMVILGGFAIWAGMPR